VSRYRGNKKKGNLQKDPSKSFTEETSKFRIMASKCCKSKNSLNSFRNKNEISKQVSPKKIYISSFIRRKKKIPQKNFLGILFGKMDVSCPFQKKFREMCSEICMCSSNISSKSFLENEYQCIS
jgi:hypothetical protein